MKELKKRSPHSINIGKKKAQRKKGGKAEGLDERTSDNFCLFLCLAIATQYAFAVAFLAMSRTHVERSRRFLPAGFQTAVSVQNLVMPSSRHVHLPPKLGAEKGN